MIRDLESRGHRPVLQRGIVREEPVIYVDCDTCSFNTVMRPGDTEAVITARWDGWHA